MNTGHIRILGFAFVLAVAAGAWAQGTDKAVAVRLESMPQVSEKGDQVEARVVLKNSQNAPVKAAEPTPVVLEWRGASGEARQEKVVIPAGADSAKVDIPLEKEGISQIRASNPGLLNDATLVNVVKVGQAAPATRPADPGTAASGGGTAPADLAVHLLPASSLPVLANGRDDAQIRAYLSAHSPQRVEIMMHYTNGSGEPNPLVIEAGQLSASAAIRSNRPGTVNARPVYASPRVRFEPERPDLSFTFVRLPAQMQVQAVDASMLDTPPLTVTLLDDRGQPVASHVKRTVTLSLLKGAVTPTSWTMEFGPDDYSKWVLLDAAGSGQASLGAIADGLPMDRVTMRFRWPYGLLAYCILGGLIGGALMAVGRQPQTLGAAVHRIVTGALAAVVLYLIALAFVTVPVLRFPVQYPIVAIGIGVIGGVAGIKVEEIAADYTRAMFGGKASTQGPRPAM